MDQRAATIYPAMDARKTKVVFLTNMLSGGGAERSLLEVFYALDRKRFDPVLWRLKPLNMYPEYFSASVATRVLRPLPQNHETQKKIESCRKIFPGYLKKARVEWFIEDGLRMHAALERMMKKSRGPLVVVSSQINMNNRAAVLQWLCNHRVPVVFIEHNEPYLRYKTVESPEKRDLAWLRIRRLYPRATHVITVSKAARKSLVSRFGLEKTHVTSIPNPIDLNRLGKFQKLKPPNHVFYKGRVPVLVCAARFHPVKNHDLLLRGFALARKRKPMKLVLLGHGELEAAIGQTIAELGLGNDVAVLPFTSEPFRYIVHSDLCVLASYSEGQGLSVIESLACGVPVVCTRWKGVGEIVEHGVNGIICDMRDKAFATGILAGLKLATSKTTRKAAKASVEKFDTSRVLPMYERLLGGMAGLGLQP